MATGTLVDVVMPQMGVSVSEGTITRWAKAVGETIEADETIVEISTDKVDTEVPSPATGIVRELFAGEGETVPVNTRIAVIDIGGDGGDEAASDGGGDGAVSAPGTGEGANEGPQEVTASVPRGGDEGPVPGTRSESAAAAPHEGNGHNGDGRTFVSPVVARMVAEHGLDIGAIPGTGRGGRVTKKDVQQFIESGATAAPVQPQVHDVPHFAPPEAPDTSAPAAPAPAPSAPAQTAAAASVEVVGAGEAGPGEELYRFNTIRKVIARHMRHSLETAAQVTTVIEVDMTGVVNLRKKWKPEYQKRHGVNLTYVPFVARATIDAIGRWPWVNAEVNGETALIKKYVNLGMAVAVDDSKGLMVPVIQHAEEKNIVGLSRSVIELADKARTKTLSPDEMSGGTFTITNPGVFGALIGTPIIPEGQVAILDVEAIVKRPVVVTDEHGNDAIAIRHMMFLCLSYDHRLVDGAYAAQFMAQVKQNLERWDEQAYGL
ncbi:MAG TPA: dihydrolipoamide acetyltransferase family protein [Gaiellales bacterium]|jgi:2-oxoglutarate dehydrogenase E2 component (dihydrolipoamide succinyltransferase)